VNTAGGVITGWELKGYREADKTAVGLGVLYKKITGQAKQEERPKKELGNVQLLPVYAGVDRKDLVPSLTLTPLDKALSKLSQVEFRANHDSLRLGKDKPAETLILTYTGPAGITVEKKLTFHNDQYKVDMAITTSGIDGYTLSLGTDFGLADKVSTDAEGRVGLVAVADGKSITEKLDSIKGEAQFAGVIDWFGQADKYFTATILYGANGIITGRKASAPKGVGDLLATDLTVKEKPEAQTFTLYAGPKSYAAPSPGPRAGTDGRLRVVQHPCQADVLAPAAILRDHEKLRHRDHPAHDRGADPVVLPLAQERHGHGGDEEDPAAASGGPRKVQEGLGADEPGNDETVQGAQGKSARRVPAHAAAAAFFRRAVQRAVGVHRTAPGILHFLLDQGPVGP